MKGGPCGLCGGACSDADLRPLLVPELRWLWTAVAAAADRRGDRDMTSGPAVGVRLPAGAAERSAAAGLTVGNKPGQQVRVPLDALTRMVRTRAPALTPGAVAAHASGRVLAERAAASNERLGRREALRAVLVEACADIPELAVRGEDLYEFLRRSGWVARHDDEEASAADLILKATRLVRTVIRLPEGERFDRRLLVPEDPHALDDGAPLAGATIALLTALGRITADPGTPARALWAQVGIDCDDLVGGLIVLGFYPAGWTVPVDAACTIPPRELTRAAWPAPPSHGEWVFVTENPSVLAAAADMVAQDPTVGPVRLLCTVGTPSTQEVAAIAQIAAVGWQVAVRADFDPAGLRHVATLLAGVPGATPWRMRSRDFHESRPATPLTSPIPTTPWDETLQDEMESSGKVAFEEALLPLLLQDLRHGRPEPS